MPYPKRGQRAATNKQKNKQRAQAAYIRKSASNQGGASVGGGT